MSRRGRNGKRLQPRALASAVALTLALQSGTVRADDVGSIAAVLVVLVVGAIGADIAFTAYDIGTAGRDERPATSWMVSQTIVTSPQAFLFTGMYGWAMSTPKEEGLGGVIVPTIWVNTMAVHGAWSLASPSIRPGPRYAASLAIGANLALTSGAIGAAFAEEPAMLSYSVPALIITAPQIALGVSQIASDASHRGGWIALTAWSGALAVNAGVNLGLRLARPRAEKKATDATRPAIAFAPAAIGGGPVAAPGVLAAGVF